MKFTVTYESGEWYFEVFSTEDEPSHADAFSIDNLDDACEMAADLLEEIRIDADPIAGLFDEDE